MSEIYDLIILGAGPAGITAVVYAARKQLNCLVITQDIGGQAALSGDIENYTGYQFITGPELALKFQEHMQGFNIPVQMPEVCRNIFRFGESIKVKTNKSEYLAKTVIVATGKRSRELNIPGEKEFKNKGVTYCATCDGPLFKDKTVAVVGGGNSALDATLSLMKICPKVYLINLAAQLTGDLLMIEKVVAAKNVEIFNKAEIKNIKGDNFVNAIEVEKEAGDGVSLSRLDVSGVFVEIGLIPNSDFAKGVKQNHSKEIVVDCYNCTDVEGVFAAGDVTNVPEKQIIIACGEGSKAALSAYKYLSQH